MRKIATLAATLMVAAVSCVLHGSLPSFGLLSRPLLQFARFFRKNDTTTATLIVALSDVLGVVSFVIMRLLFLLKLYPLLLLIFLLTLLLSILETKKSKKEIEAVLKKTGLDITKYRKKIMVIVVVALQLYLIWLLFLRPSPTPTQNASFIYLIEKVQKWLKERRKRSLRIELKSDGVEEMIKNMRKRIIEDLERGRRNKIGTIREVAQE